MESVSVDFAHGLSSSATFSEADKAKIRKRLSAAVFAINSVNTSSEFLLGVEDLFKTIPDRGAVKASVPLKKSLTVAQRAILEKALAEEHLICGRLDQVRRGTLRADVLVKTLMDRRNYVALLQLNRSRRDFDASLGVEPDLQAGALQRASFVRTFRFLLGAGQSGVAFPNANRLIWQQETRGVPTRLLLRTGDVNTNKASRSDRNFSLRPVTARPNGFEDIFSLPNHMRGYALWNQNEQAITEAPNNLVRPRIELPTACFGCHANGSLATSGERGSTPLSAIRRIDVHDEVVSGRALGRKLIPNDWSQYTRVAKYDAQYRDALEKSGGSPRALLAVLREYQADLVPSQLAAELGIQEQSLLTKISRKDVKQQLYTQQGETGSRETHFTRTLVESEVPLAGSRPSGKSLFCVLQGL